MVLKHSPTNEQQYVFFLILINIVRGHGEEPNNIKQYKMKRIVSSFLGQLGFKETKFRIEIAELE